MARELLLTDAFLRYASALARGRVWPGAFESDWQVPAPGFDAGKVLDAAIDGDVELVLSRLAPQDAAYQRLRGAAQRYRALAKTGWPSVQLPRSLHMGDRSDIVPRLRARLAAEGFGDGTATPGDLQRYDEALANSVSRYQAARGLASDGVAGSRTLAALNVPAAARLEQIGLNLERWRSLPRAEGGLRIEVNVPAATAALYKDDEPVKTMRVIVGAIIHPTPVLRARMTGVLLNPPWNVPESILRKEIVPKSKRDPGYLQRLGFNYMDGAGGGQRLVQMPGPLNALGQLKFDMPNPADVYMHDTPERQLFARPQRDFSHGCIRVEDPRDLAATLLDSDRWSRQAIDDAIASGETQNIPLPHEAMVNVYYWTAFVDPDGTVEFRDDVYGRDEKLARALASQQAPAYVAAWPVSDNAC